MADASTSKQPAPDLISTSMGMWGRWQLGMWILICLTKFMIAWHHLSYPFIAPSPKITCVNASFDACSSKCPKVKFDTSTFPKTIEMTFDLICGRKFLVALQQTFIMLGVLVGNIVFGTMADKFGRRYPLVVSVLLQGVSGLAASFVPWYAAFVVFRFLLGVATGGAMVTGFVLIMELIGVKWRTVCGVLYQLPFNVGHMLLPVISYFIRDWQIFHMVLSVPSLFLIFYICLLPESPRYLLNVGKEEQAIAVMTRAAKANKLPTDEIPQNVKLHLQKQAEANQKKPKEAGNVINLFRTYHMRINTICMWYNWFSSGFCFYGVAFYAKRIGGNFFINQGIIAVLQIPGTLATLWCVKALGRKYSVIGSSWLATASFLVIACVPPKLQIVQVVASSIGMFAMAITFFTVYIYAGELFPTTVRNAGVGTSSMCARIGAMICPFVVALMPPWLPPVILALVPFIGGLICFLLPETLDCKLPDNVDELEEFCRNQKMKKHQEG